MSRGSRTVLVWLVTCLAALVALTGWSMASPPGSSPDDDYHLASIWCAQGVDPDRCASVEGEPGQRLLPLLASGAGTCFATDFAASGACQDDLTSTKPQVATGHGNWGGAYPPYFYRVMSVFIGPEVPRSVLAMRLASSVIVVALVAGLAALLPRRRRPLAAVPLVLTSVPLSLSVLASTNPSGWAVLGAATLWPALYVAFEVDGWRRNALAAFAVLAAFVGAGSRADGCLFVLMSVALVLIIRVRHLRRAPVVTAAAAVCFVLAAAIFLSSGHASALTESLGYTRPELTTTQLLLINLSSLPTLWLGAFSAGPLGRIGWLDTPLPPMVAMLTVAAWFGVLLQGWRRVFPAKLVALGLVGAALVVQPMYLLMQSHVLVGEGVQPRYVLPVLVIFTGLSLLGTRGTTLRLTPPAYWGIVAALGLAHAVALHVQVRRYVTGLDASKILFGDDLEWWWGVGPGPTLVWVAASLGFTWVTAAVLRQALVRPGRPRGSARAGFGAGRSSATPPHSA
ncbi:Predicted membrane protein [Nocardioides alpinus]|uniref:DUF2142 domain-containing protein n=1 Tax=Nocardioides alpinus TaxID=748909 RepID=A0A1I0XHG4_9ACTN|nr:DUF2142 domain-containing protein [Nocardioides alpinus]PKH44358.1 DUF2142 domain-containing protein [Nocardioides alpinus]SFB00455.1 Predicted membrane protein [Nocardioides alpinus]